MKKRIDDIEVLRAFAVILVIVEHMHFNLFAWNTPALESFYRYFGGWTGVDLFFAISGFVIARDLVPRLRGAGDRQAYVGVTLVFWVRRCWRLLPSAWTWLAIILLASVFFNRSGAWGSVTNNVVSKSASYGLYLQRTSSVNVGGNSWRDNGAGTRFTSATLQLKYGALPTPPP